MKAIKSGIKKRYIGLLIAFMLLIHPAFKVNVRAESDIKLSKGQTVYVPVYSHIYSGNKEFPFLLAVTLSIRNTDPKYSIAIVAADYYDSSGKLIQKHIKNPIQLNPLGSTRYVIKESDRSGGSGAKFIVKWKSDNAVNAPIIESVMIGTQIQQGISFTSRGQVIDEHNEKGK